MILKVAHEHGEHTISRMLASSTGIVETSKSEVDYIAVDPVDRDIRSRIRDELMTVGSAILRRSETSTVVRHIFNHTPEGATKAIETTPVVLENISRKAISQYLEYPGDFVAFCAMLAEPSIFDPAGKDMFGLAAIHKLSAWNKPEFLKVLCDHLKPKQINDLGGEYNSSCLHYSVDMGAVNSLTFLVQLEDIDFSVRDARGLSALDLARVMKNMIAVEIITKNMPSNSYSNSSF